MGRISSSVGLITGIPIEETVNQLMEINSIPRKNLFTRTESLQAEQLALSTISTRLLAVQFEVGKLDAESLYQQKQASSSNPSALTVSVRPNSSPPAGTYQFRPLRTASAQQVISQRLDSLDDVLTEGTISFRPGGKVDKGILLDELNSGAGFTRGKIRITDRSGESAVIDLSYAETIDDVLDAINADTTINVTVSVDDDALVITDHTGQSGTLSVQEVGGGTTAADLGLEGISTTDASATGDDIFALHGGTRLSFLNDGNGVYKSSTADDLVITLSDGTEAEIDLSDVSTLGDVIDAINDHEDLAGKISASISADGNRLEIEDASGGGGSFTVENGENGTAADDLGIAVEAVGTTLTGRRIVSGLRGTLVRSLSGGQADAALGQVDITNRDGIVFNIDLSAAETLAEVIDAINVQAADVTATVNELRNGIVLTDSTGGSTSNLIVASADAANSAELLGIVVDDAVTKINGGSLHKQIISEATLLSSLNRGSGVQLGDFAITDSNGVRRSVDLNSEDDPALTLGDVIDRINALTNDVSARLNDTGDGLLLVDQAGGSSTLFVEQIGSGSTVADLGLNGEASDGVIDGTFATSVTIEEDETLKEFVARFNNLELGLVATAINDGFGVRLSFTVDTPGAANEVVIDAGTTGFAFDEVSKAQDSLLVLGSAASGSGGILLSSADNRYTEVIDGLNITVTAGSTEPVVVNVAKANSLLLGAAQEFVTAYNALRGELSTLTNFNETDLSTGILFGTSEALRVDVDLARVVTDRYFSLGSFESLVQVGFSLNSEGLLELDTAKLQAAFNEDPAGLKEFFANKDRGLVKKFDDVVDRLAGLDNSLLGTGIDSLQATIDINNERITQLDAQLERQRERLLLQFFQLEEVIAGLQTSLTALGSLQPIPPLGTSSSN